MKVHDKIDLFIRNALSFLRDVDNISAENEIRYMIELLRFHHRNRESKDKAFIEKVVKVYLKKIEKEILN